VHPGERAVQPGERAVHPGERSVQPGEHAVHPGEHAVQPGERAVQPGERAVQPVPGERCLVCSKTVGVPPVYEVFGISPEEAVREMRFRIYQKTFLTASAGELRLVSFNIKI